MEVFYFTSLQFAINNLALRRLKVSHYRDLNDPFELRAINIHDRTQRKEFEAHNSVIDQTEGLICFSSNWQNPLMWSHYADKHRGVALGFEVPDDAVEQVSYQRSFSTQPRASGADDMTRLFKRLRIAKFADWSYEEEVRQFITLADAISEGGMYFVPFGSNLKLRQVLLGPRCTLRPSSLGQLLQPIDGSVRIVQTKMASQRFDMAEAASNTAAFFEKKRLGGVDDPNANIVDLL